MAFLSDFLLGIEWGWYADGPVKELERVHPVEAVFVVVTFGFMLDEFAASKEHGWTGKSSLLLLLFLSFNERY